jgi:hypothetical protein
MLIVKGVGFIDPETPAATGKIFQGTLLDADIIPKIAVCVPIVNDPAISLIYPVMAIENPIRYDNVPCPEKTGNG